MPKYCYQCTKCDSVMSILRPKPLPAFDCPACVGLGRMERIVQAPTARMVETLDNGLMARRIERPANAEQLYKDRARETEAAKTKL